jgi:hypothetical protein
MPHWLPSLFHWLHWGDVPAYLGAAISALFGFLSWRSSRRSKAAELEAEQQAERAIKAAEDAAAAQEQTAEETKRLATAQERQTHLAEQQARGS